MEAKKHVSNESLAVTGTNSVRELDDGKKAGCSDPIDIKVKVG
jgi:hypothetical protein